MKRKQIQLGETIMNEVEIDAHNSMNSEYFCNWGNRGVCEKDRYLATKQIGQTCHEMITEKTNFTYPPLFLHLWSFSVMSWQLLLSLSMIVRQVIILRLC